MNKKVPPIHFHRTILLAIISLLAACAPTKQDDLPPRIDSAIARARSFLLSRQSPDGAWRSHVYGFFKDGPTLTGHVAANVNDPAAAQLAANYLAGLANQNGKPLSDLGLIYPVYTSADAVRLLRAPQYRTAHDAWRQFLLRQQLTESLGWAQTDLEFGGWSYALKPPAKPSPGQTRGPWDWSNLSATRYALDALRADGLPASDPICAKALVFIQRCQNNDGGFFFSCADEIHNKAGLSARDASGHVRFNSYGSATVDGYAALRLCGLPKSNPHVQAAAAWLINQAQVDQNPGLFDSAHQDIRDATYYYYCHGLAWFCLDAQQPFLAHRLAAILIARQRPDGSWSNPGTRRQGRRPLGRHATGPARPPGLAPRPRIGEIRVAWGR
jgi:squalene cyclase